MTTTTEYQGHLPDGNPVQQHSAGEYYPCVLFQRGLDADTRYYILFDGIDYYMGKDQQFQIQTAKQVMQISTDITSEDSLDIRRQKLNYTTHKRHQVLLEASDSAAHTERTGTELASAEVKLNPKASPLYYSIAAASKEESTEARHYVLCLQAVLRAALQGNLTCCATVPRHCGKNIEYSLQEIGFDVQYRDVHPALTELKITWD